MFGLIKPLFGTDTQGVSKVPDLPSFYRFIRVNGDMRNTIWALAV